MELTENAKRVLEEAMEGIHPNEMNEELQQLAEQWSSSDGFEYHLWEGGLNLEDILVGEDLIEAQKAAGVLAEVRDLYYRISLEY